MQNKFLSLAAIAGFSVLALTACNNGETKTAEAPTADTVKEVMAPKK